MEMETKILQDEFATLKAAIEEAIIKGQKSLGDPNNIPESGLVSNDDFVFTRVNAGSGVVGWIDDF
jgi:hypothetical protein